MDSIYLHPTDLNIVTEHFRHGWTTYGDEPTLIVELDAIDRQTLDAWIPFIIELRMNWPDINKPIFTIVDVSKNDISMTSLVNKRIRDLANYNPNLITYDAVVVRQSVMGKIVTTSTALLSHAIKSFHIQVFHDRDSAYRWLIDAIEQNKS